MARGSDVLKMLRPNGGWIITEDDFDSIQFVHCEPVTKEEFEAGFAQFDAWKAAQEIEKAAQKTALLNRLGITENELQSLFQ